jgi:hypothetical protein
VRFQRKKLMDIQPPCKQRGQTWRLSPQKQPKREWEDTWSNLQSNWHPVDVTGSREEEWRVGLWDRQKAPTNCFSLKNRKQNTAFAAALIPCNKWRWIKSQALDGCRSKGRGLSFPVLAGGIGSSKVWYGHELLQQFSSVPKRQEVGLVGAMSFTSGMQSHGVQCSEHCSKVCEAVSDPKWERLDFYLHNSSSSSTGSGSELNKRKRASKKRAKGDDG